MSWLNTRNISPSGYDPDANVEGFIQKGGEIGKITLEAWNAVDPLHCYYGPDCNPDEYLGYAERFVEEAMRIFPFEEWAKRSGIVEELVRRSFFPLQVVPDTSDFYWASPEDIKSVSQLITERVQEAGGWEKLLSDS